MSEQMNEEARLLQELHKIQQQTQLLRVQMQPQAHSSSNRQLAHPPRPQSAMDHVQLEEVRWLAPACTRLTLWAARRWLRINASGSTSLH